jgi:hypothetical protein
MSTVTLDLLRRHLPRGPQTPWGIAAVAPKSWGSRHLLGTPLTEPGQETTFNIQRRTKLSICGGGFSFHRYPHEVLDPPSPRRYRRSMRDSGLLSARRPTCGTAGSVAAPAPAPLILPVALGVRTPRTAGRTGRRGAPLDQHPGLPCRVLQGLPLTTPWSSPLAGHWHGVAAAASHPSSRLASGISRHRGTTTVLPSQDYPMALPLLRRGTGACLIGPLRATCPGRSRSLTELPRLS